MTLTDELASALQKLVIALDGYKNCPTVQKMTIEAKRVLAKWRAREADDIPLILIQQDYPKVWQEWLRAGQSTFHLWLQEKHPEVWAEYIRRDE